VDGALTYNGHAYFTSENIETLLDNKVDKITGKQLSTNDYTTIEKNKLDGIEYGAQVNPDYSNVYEPKSTNIQNHISSTSNPHSVTKTQVGLSNVDNTSDVNKPISTAQQTAINLKADINGNFSQNFSANEFNVSVINGTSAQNLLAGAQPVNFTGDIDGSNKVFVTDEAYPNIRIKLNSVDYSADDLGSYILDILTFDDALEADDELEIYAVTAEPNIGDGFFRPKASAEVNAPINSFFYSTDQNQLAYKDSLGIISYVF